jgi:hypothetical protein
MSERNVGVQNLLQSRLVRVNVRAALHTEGQIRDIYWG